MSILEVKKLYVKFFDVEWNGEQSSAQPVAKLSIDSASLQHLKKQQVQIIPVVFITNEALTKLDTSAGKELATKIMKLLSEMLQKNQLNQVPEFQLDRIESNGYSFIGNPCFQLYNKE